MDGGAWWAAVHGVAKSRAQLSDFTFTFHFHALEKEMATQSSVLAWRIPGTGEPAGLLSVGSHRVGHDWSDLAAAAATSYKYLKNHYPVILSVRTKYSRNCYRSHRVSNKSCFAIQNVNNQLLAASLPLLKHSKYVHRLSLHSPLSSWFPQMLGLLLRKCFVFCFVLFCFLLDLHYESLILNTLLTKNCPMKTFSALKFLFFLI